MTTSPELTKLVAVGAESGSDLARKAKDLSHAIESHERSFDELVAENDRDVSSNPERLAIATRSVEELSDQLARASKFLETGKGKRMLAGRGVFVSDATVEHGLLAMLFPGQGAQSVGMLTDLADRFDVVAKTFDEADAVLEGTLGRRLTDFISGKVGKTPEEAQKALTQTSITQPAILCSDIAMLRLLAAHSLSPDIVAGHSLGEYAACVAASMMSVPDALRAVSERGKAMTHATPEGTDKGRMAAIAAPLEEVEPILSGIEGYVIPANKNCQAQTIIAGESSAVELAMSRFDEDGFQTIRLPVSHAFHTSIVEPACGPLSRFLKGLDISPPKIPILANVTGAEYPTGPDAPTAAVELLSRQVASPVEFISEVERMYELGARTFLEVGPKRTLTSFVSNILGKRPHYAFATNNPRRGDRRSFVEALAGLRAAGFSFAISPIAPPASNPT